MPLSYSFSSALPPISGKVLGPGSCIEIVIEERSAGDGHPFDIILGDLALITSPVAGSVRKLAIDDTRRVCEKYFQRLKLIGTGAVMSMGYTTFASTYPRMVRTPILRLVSDMAPVSGILPIDPRNSLVLELARSRVQILAEAPPYEPLLEATLELDAEWRPAELEGHFLKERQDGAIWRRMDGSTWVSRETVDTQGSAFTHPEEVDDSLSKFMNRARTQFELNALEKRLIDELLVGNEVSNDTLAVRQKLLDKLNGPTRSSGSM
jgi:hypothetical protein